MDEQNVWNAHSGQFEREIVGTNLGWGIFLAEGKTLVTGRAGSALQAWEVGSWKDLAKPSYGYGVLSPDGTLFAAFTRGESTIQLLDPASGNKLATLKAPNPLPIAAACFSPDGSRLAAACNNLHVVQLWDLRAIRARLREMELDWNLPDYPPPTPAQPLAPLQVELLREPPTQSGN